MEYRLNPKIFEVLKNGTPAQRKYVFRNSKLGPLYFAIYYFPHFFTHAFAPYHYEFIGDIVGLFEGRLDEVHWIGFRESAKTSVAKLALIIYAICFRLEHYINVDSYDKANAEATLFDVSQELMINKRLAEDFGKLYSKRRRSQKEEDEEGSEVKRIGMFITRNKVKVEAFSTGSSTRGRLFGRYRPGLYLIDDVENEITKQSWAITTKIIDHINALRAGMGPGAKILYLTNYIQEGGVATAIMEHVKSLGSRGVVRNVKVLDDKGKPTWPGRFVLTDAQAVEANMRVVRKEKNVISVESKRRSLGETVFAVEMMNEPGAAQDFYFDRERIKELMAKARKPDLIDAGVSLWGKFNPKHAYSWGSDHASGHGGDHNASVGIDISIKPNRVVASYANNEIDHEPFAFELRRQLLMFGSPIIVPEYNYGYACIATLVRPEEDGGCGYTHIYLRQVKNKTTGKPMDVYGFWMSQQSRPDVLSQFKSAVQDGDLEILDLELLEECYRFTLEDARDYKVKAGQTRHFDKLIAAALAWEGRHLAKVAGSQEGQKDKYKAPLPRGEYKLD